MLKETAAAHERMAANAAAVVAAAEAKETLAQRATPFVTVLGTHGGSGMAASAVNTLLRIAAGGEGV